MRARRRAARLDLPPYGYLYAATVPYPPPRGYFGSLMDAGSWLYPLAKIN
jgi:hypothetical protein